MTNQISSEEQKKLYFEPFFKWIKDGKIDGFFVSEDNSSFVKDHPSIEKLNLVSYKASHGVLLLKNGRHTRYGFETTEDFAHDCALGLLQCKTAVGALTLGPTRKLSGSIDYIYLYGSGLNAAPVFYGDSPSQSESIRQMLLEVYPGALVRILKSDRTASFERFQPILHFEKWKILLFKSPLPIRRWFRLMLGSAFLTILSLLLNLFGFIGQIPSWLALFAFTACFMTFLGQVFLERESPSPNSPLQMHQPNVTEKKEETGTKKAPRKIARKKKAEKPEPPTSPEAHS